MAAHLNVFAEKRLQQHFYGKIRKPHSVSHWNSSERRWYVGEGMEGCSKNSSKKFLRTSLSQPRQGGHRWRCEHRTLPGAGQPRGGSAWRWTGRTQSPSGYSAPAPGPWPRRSHPGCPRWAPRPSASAPAHCWSSSPAPSGRPGSKFVKTNFQLPSPNSNTYYMKQARAPNIMHGSPTPTV